MKEAKDYGIADYKAIIHFKKIKSDKAVPSRAIGLKWRYEDIISRNNLSLVVYLTDRGYYNDEDIIAIADRLFQHVADEIDVAAELSFPRGGELSELNDLLLMEQM